LSKYKDLMLQTLQPDREGRTKFTRRETNSDS